MYVDRGSGRIWREPEGNIHMATTLKEILANAELTPEQREKEVNSFIDGLVARKLEKLEKSRENTQQTQQNQTNTQNQNTELDRIIKLMNERDETYRQNIGKLEDQLKAVVGTTLETMHADRVRKVSDTVLSGINDRLRGTILKLAPLNKEDTEEQIKSKLEQTIKENDHILNTQPKNDNNFKASISSKDGKPVDAPLHSDLSGSKTEITRDGLAFTM